MPYYRGEFDQVASHIVWWTPYAHFHEIEEDSDGDHDIFAEDWEAHFAGLARVPFLCYDIVEYQHPDRVLRQFGLPQGIPPPPVSMTEYRLPWNSYDWRAVWFAEIGEWSRFLEQPEALVALRSHSVDDTGYMHWYADISQLRVGKPELVSQSKYSIRELFDNFQAFQLVNLSPITFVFKFVRLSSNTSCFLTFFIAFHKTVCRSRRVWNACRGWIPPYQQSIMRSLAGLLLSLLSRTADSCRRLEAHIRPRCWSMSISLLLPRGR